MPRNAAKVSLLADLLGAALAKLGNVAIVAGLAGLLGPPPAGADLSFTQIVQAQTSAGSDGLFGKSWVEARGERMRIVSAYARRLRPGKEAEAPRRVVQILDLVAPERLLLYPDTKAYARAPLSPVDYGHRLREALDRGSPSLRISSTSVESFAGPHLRRHLGVECAHFRITARMALAGPGGEGGTARMVQDVWLAPLTGDLAGALLELMAFENGYRTSAGSALSPLDHERYQAREAAAHLRLPEEELLAVVSAVREKFRDLPGYPVASSVAWWREGEPAQAPAAHPPRPTTMRKSPAERRLFPRTSARVVRRAPAPGQPSFTVVDWQLHERRMNRLYRDARRAMGGPGRFPLPLKKPRTAPALARARPREGPLYPRFERELRRILLMLVEEQDARPSAGPPVAGGRPFYEVYAELHGLERPADVPDGDLKVPKGFREVAYVGK